MSTYQVKGNLLLRFLDHTQLDIRLVGILCMSDQHVAEADNYIKQKKNRGRT